VDPAIQAAIERQNREQAREPGLTAATGVEFAMLEPICDHMRAAWENDTTGPSSKERAPGRRPRVRGVLGASPMMRGCACRPTRDASAATWTSNTVRWLPARRGA
jgi:hypothetical protein